MVETAPTDPVDPNMEGHPEKKEEGPVDPEQLAGSKRKAGAPPLVPRLKKPLFRHAPAPR